MRTNDGPRGNSRGRGTKHRETVPTQQLYHRGDPVQVVLDALRRADCRPKRSGSGWSARCPAHDDKVASLSIGVGHDGRALLCCHAGCTAREITDALGLTLSALFPDDGHQRPRRRRRR